MDLIKQETLQRFLVQFLEEIEFQPWIRVKLWICIFKFLTCLKMSRSFRQH